MEKIFESEYRFLCILWENVPIASPKLVQICNDIDSRFLVHYNR